MGRQGSVGPWLRNDRWRKACDDGIAWNLVRITLNGDQAIATKVIGDSFVPSGRITWQASLTTGVGQMQYVQPGFSNPFRVPSTLEIVSSDEITILIGGDILLPFRRVD